MKKTNGVEHTKQKSDKAAKPLDPILEHGLEELADIETIFSPYWAMRSLYREK